MGGTPDREGHRDGLAGRLRSSTEKARRRCEPTGKVWGLKAKDTSDVAAEKKKTPDKKASSRSKTAAASPGAAARKLLNRELTMEIGVVGGKGLASKGGSANPYCELKLREVQDGRIGADH